MLRLNGVEAYRIFSVSLSAPLKDNLLYNFYSYIRKFPKLVAAPL